MRPNQVDTAVPGHDPSASVPVGNSVDRNAAMALAPTPVAPAVSAGLGFPSGLAPSSPEGGLPAHLGGDSAPATITPAQAAELAAAFGEAAPVETPPAAPAVAPTPALQLSEHTKLKCPKCDTTQSASNKTCTNCGHNLASARKAKFAKLDASAEEHQAVIYNTQGLTLSAKTDDDGLIWKVACKTGTLALSPGPGQVDLEKPLELTGDLFDDMLLSFSEKAFPYVTVPETHANGALENTGYVRKAEALTRDELLADQRFSHVKDDIKSIIEADPEDTRYLLAGIEFTEPDVKAKAERGSIPDTSIGVKFGYRNKRTGKKYAAAWEHLSLTPMPWIDGLVPFGLSQQGGIVDADNMTPYDGVYVPTNYLALSARISVSGDDYDEGQARTAIEALNPGDSWSWNYDVTVQALEVADADDAPGATDDDAAGEDTDNDTVMYLLQPSGYIDEEGGMTEPLLYTDTDTLLSAVSERVAQCQARREAMRARNAAVLDSPAVASYSQEGGEAEGALDLGFDRSGEGSIIHFDPKRHPRDFHGKFVSVLDNLKPGQTVTLPGGASVRKDFDAHGGLSVEGPDGKSIEVGTDVEKAAVEAFDKDPESLSHLDYETHKQDPSALDEKGQQLAKALDEAGGQAIPVAQGLKPGEGAPAGQWTKHAGGDMEIEMPDNGPTARISQTEHGGSGKWSASVFPTGDAQKPSVESHDFSSDAEAKKWADAHIQHAWYNKHHVPVMDKSIDDKFAEAFGRVQVDDSDPNHASFSLPGGDDEEHEYSIERVKDSPWTMPATQTANGQNFVLTELPFDAYDDETDEYDPEQLTFHALDTASMDEAIKKAAGILKDRIGSSGNHSVQPPEDGTLPDDEDLLGLVQGDELPPELQASQDQENKTNMPATAEELLASQQAELEASAQRIADLEARLESQGEVLLSQGTTLHEKTVNEKVVGLQKAGIPPVLCLAAREVYLQDNPASRAASGDEGLNLSVQVPKKDADGEFEERKLQTPSDIVDHLLASVPRGEATEAASVASVLGALDLSASLNPTEKQDPEVEGKAAVDAYEKSRHPERFNEDGSRK